MQTATFLSCFADWFGRSGHRIQSSVLIAVSWASETVISILKVPFHHNAFIQNFLNELFRIWQFWKIVKSIIYWPKWLYFRYVRVWKSVCFGKYLILDEEISKLKLWMWHLIILGNGEVKILLGFLENHSILKGNFPMTEIATS